MKGFNNNTPVQQFEFLEFPFLASGCFSTIIMLELKKRKTKIRVQQGKTEKKGKWNRWMCVLVESEFGVGIWFIHIKGVYIILYEFDLLLHCDVMWMESAIFANNDFALQCILMVTNVMFTFSLSQKILNY